MDSVAALAEEVTMDMMDIAPDGTVPGPELVTDATDVAGTLDETETAFAFGADLVTAGTADTAFVDAPFTATNI